MTNDTSISGAVQVEAPDGSTVHILGAVAGAGTAVFELPPHAVARAVRHPRVEEVWFVLAGTGRLWRRTGSGQDLGEADLIPGASLVLPRGTSFQFRNDGDVPLQILGTTSPLWEGPQDAELLDEGAWAASV